MHGLMAEGAGGAWTFGGSILTFAFPMLLFITVATTLYVLYTKPEFVPGHRAPWVERSVSYTAVPGKPKPDHGGQAGAPDSAPARDPGESSPHVGSVPPDSREPEGGE